MIIAKTAEQVIRFLNRRFRVSAEIANVRQTVRQDTIKRIGKIAASEDNGFAYQTNHFNRQEPRMPLRTRENPETGMIEVLVNDDWVDFDSYRKKQIDDAYQNSVRFLRERLGEDAAGQIVQNSADDSSPTEVPQ